MVQTFDRGARGDLIVALQEALEGGLGRRFPSGRDGRYGNEVMGGIIEFANAQPKGVQDVLRRERAMFGQAGPSLWSALGLEWPERFARCLQLTAAFEGTGITGSCGPRQTGDNAGVTYGIIGFTSYNGELQELLETARQNHGQEFDYAGNRILGVMPFTQFKNLLVHESHSALEAYALDARGNVRGPIQDFLQALGEMTWMKRMQLDWAFKRYWVRSCKQTELLFGEQASDRAYSLMFDIAVQNGGLTAVETGDLAGEFMADRVGTELDRMYAINTALIQRLRNAKRSKAIIEDVRSRKGTIANGSGAVHGDSFRVGAFAL